MTTPLPEQGGFNELQEFIKSCFGMEPKEDWYDSYRYDDRVRIRDFILADRKQHELDAVYKELISLMDIPASTVDAWADPAHQRISDRIFELKAERERLGK